jgi:hypothetical protein
MRQRSIIAQVVPSCFREMSDSKVMGLELCHPIGPLAVSLFLVAELRDKAAEDVLRPVVRTVSPVD